MQQAQDSRDAIAALRKNADLAGKTLAGLGTTAATALGATKLAGVFPQPPGADYGLFLALLIAGIAAALFAVLSIALRLWKLTDPIPSRSDVDRMGLDAGLKPPERNLVEGVYRDTAALNGVSSPMQHVIDTGVGQTGRWRPHPS